MKYFDSHAHYYDERFSEELEMGVDDLIDTLLKENVSYIVNIGTSPETSRQAIEQEKLNRAKKLKKLSKEEREVWLKMNKEELEEEQ